MLAGMLIALCSLTASPEPVYPIPAESAILKTLRPGHPRLIGLPEDLARVKQFIAKDPRAAEIYRKVKRDADRTLDARPVEHKLIGPRLLDQSRRCLDRVYTLATAYRVSGDRRYAERALKEMKTAAAFPDWNPKHFLDTAEMTHALAIGYDWLYDFLSPEDRRVIREAIVTKGLREAEKVYRDQRWWSVARHNWSQVCNGGISLGALAIADEEPELAAYILNQACRSVQIPMREFAPDGAWAEGPGYWNYATRYNVYMLAGLESALGTDFGLSRFPGFDLTGKFRMHFIGPTGKVFNYADGHEGAGSAAQMFWFARKFDNPVYAWHERDVVGGDSPLHLWWFDPRSASLAKEPTARWFHNADVVLMRSAWDDPNATFVGFKGGDNKANHSHLELGMFVMDALGVRWALDLGSDNYNLPAYFGNKRWTYYRLATEGQNTLWIDRKNQDPKAVAPIMRFETAPGRSLAIADLSAAYAGQAKKALRGIMLAKGQVLVQDEITGAAGAEVAWQMHTKARIQLKGDQAVLTQDGKILTARILSPKGARFEIVSANPPEPQGQQPDVHKLTVRVEGQEGLTRVAVLLTPGGTAGGNGTGVKPLEDWAIR